LREFGRIWSAYLRGQVLLGLVIFLVVWLGLALLGVQNSLALGLLSGLLEFIPVLGPIIGAGAAIIVALFQPDTLGQMGNWQYAGVVLIFMLIVQQLENNILVPRIVGESLELHPIIVIVGVFMGSSLAGVLGAILAAPVVATLKLLSIYAWRKMFDQPPFPNPEKEPGESTSARLLKRGQQLLPKRKKESKPAK
jgi:predicted PurR-regulated permease PerM